ncbi:hypothetical protein GCM10011611_04400 [Aliidongia dinghuensis]|uniref:DUF1444 family protein n=1 Tax=Aliidongia dinghuensis TaxID=1867774 RepID=A0A8J2YPM5_9PROT|nr:hypothetical protein [Aliidongia dinghuensis]GGF02011.1 hypothetical protein GCM10011611_04400 [Aliidongia dinghuensis]
MVRLSSTLSRTCRAGALCVVLLVLLAAPAALAASIPLDEPGFTKAVAKLFRKAMPGTKIKVEGPLALEVRPPDGGSQRAQLDTIYSFCQRNPADCDAAVEQHVARMSATFLQLNVAPDRKLLRAVLRPSVYVEQIRKIYAGKEEPPIEPFVGDLWIVCAFDMPEAIKYLAPGDLAKMNLSKDEALAIAKKNNVEMFQPIERAARAFPDDGVGIVSNNAYDSSRLLAFDSWAPIAAKTGGQLLASAPAADAVIFFDARRPDALDIMRRYTAMVAAHETRPFPPQIFRWSPAGWIVTE